MRPIAPLRSVHPSSAPRGAGGALTLPNICHFAVGCKLHHTDLLQVVGGRLGALASLSATNGRLWEVVGGAMEVHLPGESAQISFADVNCRESLKRAACVTTSGGRMEPQRTPNEAEPVFALLTHFLDSYPKGELTDYLHEQVCTVCLQGYGNCSLKSFKSVDTTTAVTPHVHQVSAYTQKD